MSKPKQNRGRSIDLQSTKKKTKIVRSIKWTDEHFRELYPKYESTKNYNQERCLSINIIYRGLPLKAQIPIGTSYSDLPMHLHKAIYDYLVQQKDRNSLIKCALVVGFETGDLLMDYKISIGKGTLSSKINFNCVEYVAEGRLNKYKIQKCLAIGGFSKVYLVRSLRDGQFYAMKVMMKQFISENLKQNVIENQKSICQNLNHPFIVKLNHCFQTHHFVCFILDYCPGGQLFYYLKQVKRMSEEDARFYFIQILYGLMYLHQNKIIYRDLKPENLLISHDGHIKIADFGLSKSNMGERQVTYSFCGSTQYMPPQMILRQGHSFSVDYYTLGALLYQLVTGLPPFYSRDQQEIKDSIVNEQLSFPNCVQLSTQIKNLLSSLLNKNPKHRIGSFSGVKQILFHPWVGKVNSQMVLSKKLNPPHLPSFDAFNFDENQLGQDEQQFTDKLKKQHLIPISKEKLFFKDFHFTNQHQLKPQLTNIFKKYSIKPTNISKQSQSLTKAFSMKNLTKQNKSKMKRQSSTPYLTHKNDRTLHNTEKFSNSLKYSLDQNFSSKNGNVGYLNKKLKSTYQQAFAKKSQTIIKKQLKQNIFKGSIKQKKKSKFSVNSKSIQNI